MVIREGCLEEEEREPSLRVGEEWASARERTGCWGSAEVGVADVTRGPWVSPTEQGRLGLFSAAVFMRDASGIRQAWWGPSSWDTQRPRLTAGRAQGRGHTHTGRVQGPWARSHGAGGAVGMLTQGVFRGRGHTPTGGFRGCRRTLARAGDMVTCKPG